MLGKFSRFLLGDGIGSKLTSGISSRSDNFQLFYSQGKEALKAMLVSGEVTKERYRQLKKGWKVAAKAATPFPEFISNATNSGRKKNK